MRLLLPLVAAASLAATIFVSRGAEAACMSVADFNKDAAAKGYAAKTGAVKFRVTGIDPNGLGSKGVALSTIDTRTNIPGAGPCTITTLKIYGPGPDIGTVKDEVNNGCCVNQCTACGAERTGTVGCETWVGPARSAAIFSAASQTCDIEFRFSPTELAYAISCDDGKSAAATSPNQFGMEFNQFLLLEGPGGWAKINGATATGDQVCADAPGSSSDAGADAAAVTKTMTAIATEDVTVASDAPGTVYADPKDLVVEANLSEVFLKFAVPSEVANVTKATLSLTNTGGQSADGDGASLYRASSDAWSESTLTWNARPQGTGSSLGHVGPVTLNQVVSFDVTSVVKGAGTYSFALVPEAADANGTHFFSKEGSPTAAPTLVLEYTPSGTSPGGADAGPSGCTGPKPCGGGGDAGASTGPENPDAPSSSDRPQEGSGGGGCSVGSRGSSASYFLLGLLFTVVLTVRFRRRR